MKVISEFNMLRDKWIAKVEIDYHEVKSVLGHRAQKQVEHMAALMVVAEIKKRLKRRAFKTTIRRGALRKLARRGLCTH